MVKSRYMSESTYCSKMLWKEEDDEKTLTYTHNKDILNIKIEEYKDILSNILK
jgi:hypothetical protein